jgi:hypothetical protein
MVLNRIEKLLEKYENAETTLQEEQQLKNYFSQETVAPHLEVYKPMFAYFLKTQNEEFTKDLPLKSEKTNSLYTWISVAAVAIIMLGVYFTQINSARGLEDLNQEELLAYNQAMEAFGMLSANFNKGAESINSMALVSESLNKSNEQVGYLGEFDNTIDKFFKTNE